MSISIDQVYPYFFDKDKSRALFNASIYIGDPNLDPQDIPQNLKVVVGIQEDGTEVPLNQPLTTNSGGGIQYNGAPIRVKVDPPYSMLVLDRKGKQEYYWSYINPTGGAPTIGVTVQEPAILADGQTVVNLANQLNGYISVRINGLFVDDSVLVSGVDYTPTSQTQITLTNSYPAGTILTVTQNDLSGDSKGPVNCYETVAAAEAAALASGSCFIVQELGNAKFTVKDLSYTKLTGDLTIGNGLPAQLQLDSSGEYNVEWFGAVGTDSAVDQLDKFNLAVARANEEANGDTKVPFINVPRGDWRVSAPLNQKGNWYVSPNAVMYGLPAVSPSNERDTSYLIGTVITKHGVDQQRTIQAGDPSFQVQKYTGKAFTSEITGNGKVSGGVTGTAQTAERTSRSEGVIGGTFVALTNNTSIDCNSWACYFEAYKTADALDTSGTQCLESTIFNDGTLVTQSPYRVLNGGEGGTTNLWLTTGGIIQGNQQISGDTSFCIGMKGKEGSEYHRGIVVSTDTISTGEVLATPSDHGWTWYGLTTTNQEVRAGRIQGRLANDTGGLVTLSVFDASLTGTQLRELYSFGLDNFTAGDSRTNLGSPSSRRWLNIFLQNSPDVVSDETKKTEIRNLTQDELNAGLELARNVKSFKWTGEVEQKGSEDSYEHVSIMAQKVWEILLNNNLDPSKYGFVSNDENGWSIIRDELNLFINAAIVAKLDTLGA